MEQLSLPPGTRVLEFAKAIVDGEFTAAVRVQLPDGREDVLVVRAPTEHELYGSLAPRGFNINVRPAGEPAAPWRPVRGEFETLRRITPHVRRACELRVRRPRARGAGRPRAAAAATSRRGDSGDDSGDSPGPEDGSDEPALARALQLARRPAGLPSSRLPSDREEASMATKDAARARRKHNDRRRVTRRRQAANDREPSVAEVAALVRRQAAERAARREKLASVRCRCDRPLVLAWRHRHKCGRDLERGAG
jgi:hypothetical protein